MSDLYDRIKELKPSLGLTRGRITAENLYKAYKDDGLTITEELEEVEPLQRMILMETILYGLPTIPKIHANIVDGDKVIVVSKVAKYFYVLFDYLDGKFGLENVEGLEASLLSDLYTGQKAGDDPEVTELIKSFEFDVLFFDHRTPPENQESDSSNREES